MSTITFSAARRRFERAHDDHRTISKLSKAERQGTGDSAFALVEGNTIMDAGDLTAVERWCRDAGVLSTGETVTKCRAAAEHGASSSRHRGRLCNMSIFFT